MNGTLSEESMKFPQDNGISENEAAYIYLRVAFEVELKERVGDLSAALSTKHEHLAARHRHGEVTAGRRALTFLFYALPLVVFTLLLLNYFLMYSHFHQLSGINFMRVSKLQHFHLVLCSGNSRQISCNLNNAPYFRR